MTNAVQSGFSDPRFQPLTEAELEGLRLDVSILSHPRPVPAANEAELATLLEPDRDGLILGAGQRRALFLPSVWRQVQDGREFVRHLLTKAGLSGWPHGVEAARFRVESFGAKWRRIAPGEIAPVRIDDAPALH
jgi:AmmeMemoRadiSam system protein A